MADLTQQPQRLPRTTLKQIARTPMLTTREKLDLLLSLRNEASRVQRPRKVLGFDAGDVDNEMNRLRDRVLRGVGPRIDRQEQQR